MGLQISTLCAPETQRQCVCGTQTHCRCVPGAQNKNPILCASNYFLRIRHRYHEINIGPRTVDSANGRINKWQGCLTRGGSVNPAKCAQEFLAAQTKLTQQNRHFSSMQGSRTFEIRISELFLLNLEIYAEY